MQKKTSPLALSKLKKPIDAVDRYKNWPCTSGSLLLLSKRNVVRRHSFLAIYLVRIRLLGFLGSGHSILESINHCVG